MIPEGMHDVLSPESGELRAIEATLCRRFAAYGYAEVRTPLLEVAETFDEADDDILGAGYRTHDAQGNELMLRTDMTVPVARLAADRYADRPLPLRFCYVGSAVRPWAPRRSPDGEFAQAGVELLGLRSAAADAECVTVLCDALTSLGLKDHRVALGTVAFYAALVDSLGLVDDDRQALVDALADRDYPLLESIAGNAGVDDRQLEGLWRALELTGGEDNLAKARRICSNSAMEDAVDHLVAVHELVAEAGYGDNVTFDLGLMQDLTYYSGTIFEAYAPGVGQPIASGGRYDGLAGRFDWDVPGVGFALALDRVHEALEEAGALPDATATALAFVGGLGEPAKAAELRRAGLAVAALPEDAETDDRPLLTRRGGSYVLERADGTRVEGGWREVRAGLVRR